MLILPSGTRLSANNASRLFILGDQFGRTLVVGSFFFLFSSLFCSFFQSSLRP